MMTYEDILVVIPARGGSKRIPDKNVRLICGQPMIHWPLMELQKAFSADNILVTTDSDSIKKMVEKKGLRVPFTRPKNLSDDFVGTVPVVSHALKWFEENVREVDLVLTVYPTAVLLNIEDIHSSVSLIKEDENCDCVMSAANFPFPIQRAVFENKLGYAEMFEPANYHERSQDLVAAKHDAGQFYLTKAHAVRRGAILTNSNVRLQMLHRSKVIDIDTLEDLDIAEERLAMCKLPLGESAWSF